MLFHINQQSSALMLELMLALAPDFRAVAIDYPNHGHSDPFEGQPDFADYTRCALAVMDHLGIERAAAMGEAVGAGVSVCIANAHPERIEKVVLINCPFSPERGRTAVHVKELQSGLRPEDESRGFSMTRTIALHARPRPRPRAGRPSQSWMDRINTAQMEVGRNRWQAVTALANFDMEDGLRRHSHPAMLLGEHFHYTKYLDEMRARIRRSDAAITAGGARMVGSARRDRRPRAPVPA